MLELETRELLMDVLRPPDGMRMDIAVGTTYTLDLDALLLAPLSFAMFDWASGDDGPAGTQATLESLRRHAANTTLFCQDGMIGVPKQYQALMLHLEDVVVPVSAPLPKGIFHPKVWVVRYFDGDGRRLWRAVILSRNLTFATSWDTVVVLEGTSQLTKHRPGGPLAHFLLELIDLGGDRLGERRRADISALAEEIRHVRFTAPEGFERTGVWFQPLGMERPKRSAFPPRNRRRTLVVSPFLGERALKTLASGGSKNDIVVSRPEELDRLPPEALKGWDCYVLAEGQMETTEEASLPTPDESTELRGLHAKLLIFERGETSSVLTGSLNATDAALHRNVEMMAWMNGPTADVGIDALLGTDSSGSGPAAFGRLLEPYTPTPRDADDEDVGEELRRHLEDARAAISRARMVATVSAVEPHTDQQDQSDKAWRFVLSLDGMPEVPPTVSSASAWRLTGPASGAVPIDTTSAQQELDFGIVAEPGITAFFAVRIEVEAKGRKDAATFLVRAELRGAPEGRAERMLARALDSRDAVIRYLQFLLAEGSEDLRELMRAAGICDGTHPSSSRGGPMTFGLTERLLEVLVTDPDRLSHVERLLADLRRVDDGALLPEGFEDIWTAIDEVRRELTAEDRRRSGGPTPGDSKP
jgi:hypothetical protein